MANVLRLKDLTRSVNLATNKILPIFVDASSLLYRKYFATRIRYGRIRASRAKYEVDGPPSPRTLARMIPVPEDEHDPIFAKTVIDGCMDIIHQTVTVQGMLNPDYRVMPVVVTDPVRSKNWRNMEAAGYKANRSNVGFNFDVFNQAVDEMSTIYPVISTPHHEADDVIYMMITSWPRDQPVVLLATDSDYYQITHPLCRFITADGKANTTIVKMTQQDRLYYPLTKALLGDKSDNISSCTGPVTAAKIRAMVEVAVADEGISDEMAVRHKFVQVVTDDCPKIDTAKFTCNLHHIHLEYMDLSLYSFKLRPSSTRGHNDEWEEILKKILEI